MNVNGQLGSKDRDTLYIITGELRDNSSMIAVVVEQVQHTQVDNQSCNRGTYRIPIHNNVLQFRLEWC